ncbi:hypothetical protein Pori4_00174 [Pseudomonas phage vB_PpuM-Pori-4]
MSIKVVKGRFGYYVPEETTNPPEDYKGPEHYPLHVGFSLPGVIIPFDYERPMLITDNSGPYLKVFFDRTNLIRRVSLLTNSKGTLTEFEVDEESGFWFVVSGKPLAESSK